jgi:hypothetical protein
MNREYKFRMWQGGRFSYWGFDKDCFMGLGDDNAEPLTLKQKQERSQQFTGLKDRSGKKIFEGDVVKCINGHIGVVEWENHDACFNVTGYYNCSNYFPTMAFMEGQPVEIIGNIHESPELVKP